jgi:lincosamide nucleotidyltransferase A/C/D/E
MTERHVLDLLDNLARAGVATWVDGGWGVDALLRQQTRDHNDLDLVVPVGDLPAVRGLLSDRGFSVERDWLPTALAMRHRDGRAVDLHPIEPTKDSGGDQILRGGERWHYTAPVTGRVGERSVQCCSPECQVAAHVGYEPDATDRADMAALAARFHLVLPAPYGLRDPSGHDGTLPKEQRTHRPAGTSTTCGGSAACDRMHTR